jgi:hypothetical protein
MKRTFLTALVATFAIALALGDDVQFSVEGVRLIGGDLGIALDGWKLVPGAGYELPDFGRDLSTGDPLSAEAQKAATAWTFINGDLKALYTWKTEFADVWAGAGVWGYNDLGTGPGSGLFADRGGNTFGFAQLGATRDRRQTNAHGVVTGTRAEALAEWGPPQLAVKGTDYVKLSFQGSHLLPLWDLDAPSHLFSGTLGFRVNAEWIDGRRVPVPLLEPTEVRGYYGLYDTQFRSVVTSELRVGLPSVWGAHDLVPVVFAFTEGGWYAGYSQASAATADRSGWLASSGAGLGLSLFGFATPTLTAGLPWLGESSPWWKINFDLRF